MIILKNNKSEEQTIKCSVEDCRYNDCAYGCCDLNEIKVCSCGDEEKKEATMCNSYKKRANK